MTLLLTYWKQLAILAIFLFGVILGYDYEKSKFDTYVAQVETQAKVAEALNAEKQRKQELISNEITKGYADAIKKLNAHYVTNRVLKPKTSSSEVPNIPTTSPGVNAETESSVSITDRDCALDVLQLLYLQQWVKDQYEN